MTNQAGPAELSEERLWNVLRMVLDPEIPVINIVEMGIVRAVALEPDSIRISITPTYSGCPALDVIKESIVNIISPLSCLPVTILTTNSPPWSSQWLTDEAREKLRKYGIAPPYQDKSNDQLVPLPSRREALRRISSPFSSMTPHIECPYCKSIETQIISEFGSTPCKSLYRCCSCIQPFEYFKPI